jgi:hypothetical protein
VYASDRQGDLGQAGTAATLVLEAIIQDENVVGLASPLANQPASGF